MNTKDETGYMKLYQAVANKFINDFDDQIESQISEIVERQNSEVTEIFDSLSRSLGLSQKKD